MRRLRFRPGFLLLLAALFWLDEGVGLLLWGLCAAALHELGHYGAGRICGRRLKSLELSAVGAQMELSGAGALSYLQEMAVTLAGPLVNLVLGWLSIRMGWFFFAGANLALAGLNLLPILPLDGGRALWCAVTCLAGEEWGERVLTVLSAASVGALAGIGAVAALHFANLSLLIVSVWLLWMSMVRKK